MVAGTVDISRITFMAESMGVHSCNASRNGFV